MRKIMTAAAAAATVGAFGLATAVPADAYAARPGVRTYGNGAYTAYGVTASFISRYDAARQVVFHTLTLRDLNCDGEIASTTVRALDADQGYKPLYFNNYYLIRSCNSYATTTFAVGVRYSDYIYLSVGNYRERYSQYRLVTFYR